MKDQVGEFNGRSEKTGDIRELAVVSKLPLLADTTR